MKRRLIGDAERFEFFKKDMSVNLNGILRVLIVNYFDSYRMQEQTACDNIAGILLQKGMSRSDVESTAKKIRFVSADGANAKKVDDSITLTVGRDSYRTIKIIEQNMLTDLGMSEYIRKMISSYLCMPRSSRERIIFRDEYQELSIAVQQRRQVSFSMSTLDDKKFTVYPYAVSASQEEQNNYFLCYDPNKKAARSFRLSRMRNIFVHAESFEINDEMIQTLKTAQEKCPQFTFSAVQESCVLLSDDGVRKYRMIYTNRPETVRIDGNKYYFKWPLVQLEEYFKRFGKDAVFLFPEEARQSMRQFYSEAIEALEK